MKKKYDVIVIGTGPAGEACAIGCAKAGKKVLAVEKYLEVGGGCTHWGTIPSKAIRQSIISFVNVAKLPYLGKEFYHLMPSFNKLLRMADQVVHCQVRMRQRFYERNGVDIVHGQASFKGNKELVIKQGNGNEESVKANFIVIATGSRPHHPAEVDFSKPNVLDSDKILNLKETPKSIVIYGAGVVGVEYASIFKNLGIKVDLINTRAQVLDFLDNEISEALKYQMRNQGIVIRNEETFEALTQEKNCEGLTLRLKSGKRIKSQYLFWAQGRIGNTEQLNLQAVSLTPNDRGQIPVNEFYQTTQANIYAVGDVVGWPNLAGAAYNQGQYVASIICETGLSKLLIENIPTGIYTSPEISCIGKTEKELTGEKIAYEVGIANFKNLAKAQILGDNVGILKILFHRDTLALLGIHCFGRQASEIIHIGQAVMRQPGAGNTIKYFLETTFNYPTMAEAYRIAALNGINRL